MTTSAKQQAQAGLQVIQALAEAVRELKSVPSGHLYTQVCSVLTLEQYNRILEILKGAGVIEVSNHEIKWVAQ